LVGYVVAIGIGFLLPRAGVVLYLVIAIFLLIPFRVLFKHSRRGRRA